MDECYLYRLPNELLLSTLIRFSTPQLLQLTLVSRRIYAAIIRILYHRMSTACKLESHSVLLECYHPSAKLTEPQYWCTYRGTDGLLEYHAFEKENPDLVGRLGLLRNMYSRFRPHRRELEAGGRKVKGTPGDIPASRTFPGAAREEYNGDTVKQTLSLDPHELFTELCENVHLVKIRASTGSMTGMVELEDRVIRVWRDWLDKMAAKEAPGSSTQAEEVMEELDTFDINASLSKGKEPAHENEYPQGRIDDDILWATPKKNTGLKVNVRKQRAPILVLAVEDTPAGYEIEYEELLIRTTHLLLSFESSLLQDDNRSGKKAVMFGSFS
ncbi:hypothetical protein GQ43DRAFT_404460 [Delitschia confertaspora ATCC 74209]|uniref:F-box domain-containing protein n=1 Tax=Delitschia confertaspora ATCC 74209 TaxID=1513339 RepID=A0A9P4JC44_9PLEO|nr:hypothetical protein GQ43DRAFT_404460 [Delitschia confertaspora ATCC 74209]